MKFFSLVCIHVYMHVCVWSITQITLLRGITGQPQPLLKPTDFYDDVILLACLVGSCCIQIIYFINIAIRIGAEWQWTGDLQSLVEQILDFLSTSSTCWPPHEWRNMILMVMMMIFLEKGGLRIHLCTVKLVWQKPHLSLFPMKFLLAQRGWTYWEESLI